MTDPELEAAVMTALRPRGLRERLRLALGGGYTPMQVWERIDAASRAALVPPEADPTVGARFAVDRVQRALRTLATAGRVRHQKVRMSVMLNTKGPRDVLVDVFRAR